jgi:hypothetical protein
VSLILGYRPDCLNDKRIALAQHGVRTSWKPLILVSQDPQHRKPELLCDIGPAKRFSSEIGAWLHDYFA